MEKEYEFELNKISRLSGIMMVLMVLSLIAFSIILLVGINSLLSSPTATGTPFFKAIVMGIDSKAITTGLLTYQDKAMILVLFVAVTTVFISFMVYSIKLLACFKKQILFTEQSVRYARILAWITFGGICFKYFWMFLAPFIFQLEEVRYKLGLGFEFFFLGVLWLVVWILQVGKALQLDSEMAI
ncbi:MAG: hypothetical protein COA71_10885 [SAR86 cluster bacterium]|uniref:DUF2975 domain-containing protein n=1 Tax=SAR86 cluster bacterium TaxID=2030880 RepID=A0A2A5CA41_9GAMM|nr:hypothetical protein [Gammaproteobacteria bacterium AH-315-E17]PCJ40358.1 MAG: hypothetical protein COA71_10885 [SAR86 cluster bacterium]